MIKFDNVNFSYGKNTVLKDFNLEINKGDKICLFGESGCGKTTVLRLILGLENVDSGNIIIDNNLKPAVVFQENRLLPFKTVLENVSLFCTDEKSAIHHLESLGLGGYLNAYPSSLSGGMKRRLAIARALSVNFDFLVLDEAFTGLDTENIILASNHILDTVGDRPIIMVTHSKYEAELLKTNIVEM